MDLLDANGKIEADRICVDLEHTSSNASVGHGACLAVGGK